MPGRSDPGIDCTQSFRLMYRSTQREVLGNTRIGSRNGGSGNIFTAKGFICLREDAKLPKGLPRASPRMTGVEP